jgi:hypothetical protein
VVRVVVRGSTRKKQIKKVTRQKILPSVNTFCTYLRASTHCTEE